VIEGAEAVRRLEAAGARLFVGVPDSLMKGFCSALDANVVQGRHVVTANEGAAVAAAAGHYLATGRPAVVYMQNSGLGNAVNPLSSLTSSRVYGIPMVLMVGWRGEPGVSDEPQHEHQGAITLRQLDLLDIPTTILDADSGPGALEDAYRRAIDGAGPVALLVRKGAFDGASEADPVEGLKRLDAIEVIVDQLPDDTAFVATTGYTGRELAMLREKREESWASDLLMVGSMGHASAIALGLALGDPGRTVCCLDGDGALVMHMGSLAAIGAEQPENLIHVVLNNGVHESVGGQPSALRNVDLLALARSVGYVDAFQVSTAAELAAAMTGPLPGPRLVDVRVVPGTVDGLPRPSDFHQRMTDMRAWLSGG
jgi:phosphonopyruvate decarboxylase